MRRVVSGVFDWPKTGIRLPTAACTAGAMVAMMMLAGCTSSAKLSDLGKPSDAATTNTASADPGDTTGSIVTQPAEPGPSGEPVAPLAKPGFLGDDPNDDLQLGKKYFRNNSFGLAQRSFQSAVEKHPNDAEAWVGLAAAYDRLHRFDLADRAYSQAMRLVGRTPEILNDMGFSFMLRGDYARANKALQEAQAKDPSSPYIQANLHLLEQSYRNGKSVQ
jgi:tetratricopeptide (TPR) repeat protein